MNAKKTALITDSGNELGETFANILLKNNYDVILSAADESFSDLSKKNNEFHLIKTNFKSDKSVFKLKEFISEKYGQLDLLINNAEIANGFGQKIEQLNIEEVKAVFDINLFAVMRLVKTMYPLLKKNTESRVINITSSIGDISKMSDESFCYSNYYLTAYASSKAALNMYTHLQCKEFSPSNISVNVFDPIALKNCTHNSVEIKNAVKEEFKELISF